MIVLRCLFNLPRFVLLLFTIYLRQLLIAIISEQGLQIKFLTIFHKKKLIGEGKIIHLRFFS